MDERGVRGATPIPRALRRRASSFTEPAASLASPSPPPFPPPLSLLSLSHTQGQSDPDMSNLLAHKSIRVAKPTRGHQPLSDGAIRTDHEIVDRLQQWKHITKSLLHYYKGLADIEHATAKSTTALMDTIQVPFHEGHAFSPDGWQAVLYDVRDNTKLLSERHANFASTIEHTVVRDLEGVRADIKQHIAAVEKEASALADDVEKERETSKHHLLELQNGIDTFENSSTQMLPQKDPYLSHHIVHNQLKKQVHKENDLQAALIRFQQQQPQFEENIAKSIQSAADLYNKALLVEQKEVAALQEKIADALQRVDADAEWKFYTSRQETTLIDPNTPLRSIDAIAFPGQNHASTSPIKEGYLERKKRFSKKYTESYYVLTPSGYLHERRSANAQDTTAPTFSLFLPECSLSAPAKESSKSHKFSIEGNKAVRSSAESRLKNTLRFGGKEIAYTFRCRTHAELLSWWETLDQLSRDTKVDRSDSSSKKVVADPVGVAVSNVGYAPATDETERTAASVAAVPGTQVVDADEHEEEEEGEQQQAKVTSSEHAPLETRSAHSVAVADGGLAHHDGLHRDEDEDSEEGGGSSEEEYATDDEMAHARSAPQTPGLASALTGTDAGAGLGSATATADESSSFYKAETLPAYVGSGTSVPEKQALVTEAKGAPILGNPISSSGTADDSAAAATNSGETDSAAFGAEAAPATSAATTSAS
ncbi:hypothetical protein DMC30DRAFT_304506 [Rhodotorula diobovata]|uniref:PH domain-containing protein n=1 Tax=Rhodotorula diobovata TaxID=5288 RepID=A0A5C5FRE0_9BASI|nr:hypothetical protein DMC30DRAFT_304506 [Rhodotorula diobovata]